MLSAGVLFLPARISPRAINHTILGSAYRELEQRVTHYQKTHSIAFNPGERVKIPDQKFGYISVYTTQDGRSQSAEATKFYGIPSSYYYCGWFCQGRAYYGAYEPVEVQFQFDPRNYTYQVAAYEGGRQLFSSAEESGDKIHLYSPQYIGPKIEKTPYGPASHHNICDTVFAAALRSIGEYCQSGS